MKNFLIILITKIIIFICKLTGKNGGNFPGQFAFNRNKNIFKYFKINCPVIAVVGTNGKTMTNNTMNAILKQTGSKVVSNLQGNNMESGILSLLNEKYIYYEGKLEDISCKLNELNLELTKNF